MTMVPRLLDEGIEKFMWEFMDCNLKAFGGHKPLA